MTGRLLGDSKMKYLFKAGVLAAIISIGGTNAFAADAAPTVSDAHELIGELIERGVVGTEDFDLVNYRGNTCKSSWGLAVSRRSITLRGEYTGKEVWREEFNWGDISSIEILREQSLIINGRIEHVDGKYSEPRTYTTVSTNDSVTRNRLVKAVNLLMNSCAKKSKFD